MDSFDQSSDVQNYDKENIIKSTINTAEEPIKKRKRRKKMEIELQKKKINPPFFKKVDGEERLCFLYDQKPSTYKNLYQNALLETEEQHEYEFCLKFNIDDVNIENLSEKFKKDNCIYPRANTTAEKYTGNRWIYENESNKIAWKFVCLNKALLYGRKGIIQKSVDTYRNINKSFKQKKTIKTLNENSCKMFLFVDLIYKGLIKKFKLNAEVESVNFEEINYDFKKRYSIFPEVYTPEDFGQEIFEKFCEKNILAIKIAYLNSDLPLFWSSSRSPKAVYLLRQAVEAYKKGEIVFIDPVVSEE